MAQEDVATTPDMIQCTPWKKKRNLLEDTGASALQAGASTWNGPKV